MVKHLLCFIFSDSLTLKTKTVFILKKFKYIGIYMKFNKISTVFLLNIKYWLLYICVQTNKCK